MVTVDLKTFQSRILSLIQHEVPYICVGFRAKENETVQRETESTTVHAVWLERIGSKIEIAEAIGRYFPKFTLKFST